MSRTTPERDRAFARRKPENDPLSRRVLQVCEAVGEFIKYWGFKNILGRVWTVLALAKRPLTQAEIVALLAVSRSQVSSAISELTELGLVRPSGTHRNTPFEAVLDIWPTISDILRQREWMLIEGTRVAVEGAIEEVELNPQASELFDVKRMRMILSMTNLAQALLRFLIRARVQSGEELVTWADGARSLLNALSKVYPE